VLKITLLFMEVKVKIYVLYLISDDEMTFLFETSSAATACQLSTVK